MAVWGDDSTTETGGTLNDKITYLSETKDAIKDAIVAKGVPVTTTDTFRSYATKISQIGTLIDCIGLTEVTLGKVGTPFDLTQLSANTFIGCTNLTKIIVYTSSGTGTANYFIKSGATYHTIEFRQS